MKARFTAPFILLAMPIILLQAGSSNLKLNFERALLLEEASGRLEEAVILYKKVVTEAKDEVLAAQAQLHVGICYEKLAKQEARKAYQAVIDNFPSQKDAVRMARERLARLNSIQRPANAITVREFVRPGKFKPNEISDPTVDAFAFVTTSEGQTFVYTDWNTGDLVVKNFATGKAHALYNIDWFKSTEFFMNPILSRDDKKVAFLYASYPKDQDYKEYIAADTLHGGSREILFESGNPLIPHDWSPDGSNILGSFEAPDRSISLVTINTKDKKMHRLVTLNWEYPIRAGYSPDGKYIAYDSTKGGDRKIYLISADGHQERVLVDSPGQDDSPLWSRDGHFLVFRSNRSGEWDLFALPMKDAQPAGDPVLIKSNIGEASFLRSLTTDGKLFYSEQLSGPDIAIMTREDSGGISSAKILPKVNTRNNSSASFAPDGKRLAYLAGPLYGPVGRQILHIATLDGKILMEVPLGPEFRNAGRLVFSPDGNKIALTAWDRKRQIRILLLATNTGKLLKTLTPEKVREKGRFISGIGWSQDGRFLYAVVKGEGRWMETIDIETEKVTSVVLPKTQVTDARNAAVSPDARYVAVLVLVATERVPGQDQQHELVVHSVIDGTSKVFKKDMWVTPLVWDSDSRHVFYQKYQKDISGGQLYRMSVETGEEVVFLEDHKGFQISAVSSDGKLLAFYRPGEDFRIWIVENFLPKAKTHVAAAR